MLIRYIIDNKINYLIIDRSQISKHFPVFSTIISENPDYLEKVIGSQDLNYKKIDVMIYRINSDKFQ